MKYIVIFSDNNDNKEICVFFHIKCMCSQYGVPDKVNKYSILYYINIILGQWLMPLLENARPAQLIKQTNRSLMTVPNV